MRISEWLKTLASEGGSDLYLSTGAPPCAKFQGKLRPIGSETLKPGEIREIANEIMDPVQRAAFEDELEMNLAMSLPGHGRFRVNIFMQRNEVSIVARNIVAEIPSWQSLRLPPILLDVIMRKRGLVLFVGATGSGKSTSLAAMIDYRNSNSAGHIVTIEDPVEYIHRHKKSIVNQREVGLDTHSFEEALRNVLRETPDVIMIGEIRDRLTMQQALRYSETGHLVLATLHATHTVQAIDRMLNLFPEEARKQLLGDIAGNLQAVIGQRLLPGKQKKRLPAVELLLRTPYIVDLIARGDLHEIKTAISRGRELGLQTFDQHLYDLYEQGAISLDEALRNADSRTDLMLRTRLERGFSAEESEMKVLRDS